MSGRVFWLLLVLFAALEAVDVVTTNHVLALPGAWEANPLTAAFQQRLGSAWWLPKALVAVWFALAATRSRRRWPMIFAVSCCSIVVAINLINL